MISSLRLQLDAAKNARKIGILDAAQMPGRAARGREGREVMNTKEMIEVMQAFEDGKKIEFRERGSRTWKPDENPEWDWSGIEYRIAPEPKKEGRWERVNIKRPGDLYISAVPGLTDAIPGFGGIDYRSPFDPKVIVRSMVPVMFDADGMIKISACIRESDRPGIPVAAWFWRE